MRCILFFFQDVHNHVVNAQFSLGKRWMLCFMICSQLQVVFFKILNMEIWRGLQTANKQLLNIELKSKTIS